jgi:tetratricopeptide (TPR) repeat protein
MHYLLNITRCFACIAIAQMAGYSASAAAIDASAGKGYGRINFTFSEPNKLRSSANGTQAVLAFDKPLTESPERIKASLPDYVSGVALSADKKTITLTLTKPMRVRQFVSSKGVGVDIVEAAPQQVAEASPKAPPPETKPAEVKPVAEATPPKETAKPPARAPIEKKPVEKKPAKPAAAPTSDADMLSTKKSAPATPAPVKEAPKEDAMLTTKAAPTPPPEPAAPIATTAAVAPPEPAPELTTKKAPTPEASPVLTTASPEASPPRTAEPAASVAPKATQPPAAEHGNVTVSAQPSDNATVIHFPWGQRTAAAVFGRSKDIWIIFSRAQNMNVGLLRTSLPKQVISATQYAYEGHTVIRLITDGNIRAHATQDAKGYGWNVVLSENGQRPALDVTMSSDSLEGTVRLILGIFDVSPALRFYDPSGGEELIIIPSFENGRAVANARTFPEFTILDSAQGVAIIAARQDLTLSQTRSGLIISGAQGLNISESLPMVAGTAPITGASNLSSVMMPYDQWYVAPDKFMDTLFIRLAGIAKATKATKADSMMEMVKLYLSEGMAIEAIGMLNLIREEFPNYYVTNKLALLSAASNVMIDHMDVAATELMAPELNELEETELWRQVVALYAPPPNATQQLQTAVEQAATAAPTTPAPAATEAAAATAIPTVAPATETVSKNVFQYLKFNKSFIRFYPPRFRQRLAVIAADAYIRDGQEEKAVAVYDVLIRDGILAPVALDAEYALGAAAEKKGEFAQALEIFDRLAKKPDNRYIAARARYSAAMLRYKTTKITGEEAAEILEGTRMTWRGDALERTILENLITLYKDSKRYDDVLRSQRAMLDAFPNHPDTIPIAGEMASLFQDIFLDGLANDMEPLKALSLFYEFRDLTPLGDQGDTMIQRLADRLAAIDLLNRATQLLENQIKFRTTGEVRSKIGARLALLHLLNKRPQEALNVLEVTNFGSNQPELQLMRNQLTAEALTKVGKYEEALAILYSDTTIAGAKLRINVLWAMKDWTNIVNRAEDFLSNRPNMTDPLSPEETEILLKLALAYSFEGDYNQLRYLRDYYSALIPDTAYKQIFDFITNDTNPLDPEDFAMLAQQINRTESFLDTFREKIAAGKLSEAIK